MKVKYFLASVIFLLFSHAIQAQDFSHPLTLAELLDIALKNHPQTKQAWWNANRAAAAVGVAKSDYYPDLAFRATATHGKDFKFINGPDATYTIFGADLFLNLLLYDFGERKASVDISKASLIASNWQLDSNIQKVMVKVLENAYATIHAYEVLQASTLSLNEAEKVLNVAKELNRTGLAAVTDVYTSEATYSQMNMDLAQQKASYDIQQGKLAASLGFSAASCIQIAIPPTMPCIQVEDTETLIEIAFKQRADLMAKQARLQENHLNKIRAKTGYYPRLSFFGRGGFNHGINDKADDGQYRLALNLDVPLFDGFETVYQNRIAYADTQISTEQLMELQLDITLEILTYSRTLQAAQEMLTDADNYLKNSLKSYEGVLDKYKAGKEGIIDLSYALRQLASARVRYSEVKTKLLVSIANLAYATGTLAPYMETP